MQALNPPIEANTPSILLYSFMFFIKYLSSSFQMTKVDRRMGEW